MDCCRTWDECTVIQETLLMRAVLDGYPVTPGHALIIPKRHVDRLEELNPAEILDLHRLIRAAIVRTDTDDFTIGVNDGPAAGRTIDHLHVHVIPRRPGDVPDPRGGVRRLLIPDAAVDPWLAAGEGM